MRARNVKLRRRWRKEGGGVEAREKQRLLEGGGG
jgi:hypothetical protein